MRGTKGGNLNNVVKSEEWAAMRRGEESLQPREVQRRSSRLRTVQRRTLAGHCGRQLGRRFAIPLIPPNPQARPVHERPAAQFPGRAFLAMLRRACERARKIRAE